MIRAGLLVFVLAAAVVAILALTGEPGRASLVWLGWRADMTAATAILLVLALSLAALVVWRLVLWIAEAPGRAARARAETRKAQAGDVLTRGFLAAAAGDGAEARRLALKAADLAQETPGLVRVLTAQAAEAAGDTAAAHAAWTAMLAFPDMRLAAHRALMQLALAQGDTAGAQRHAEAAYGLGRTARWAWRALLETRLEAGDWDGALELVRGALERKIVSPIVAERARAALLAASAARLEHEPDPKAQELALERATEAAKRQPGFAPGVVMAARLLAEDGKLAKATGLIETAWKAAPHPALWLAYRDLRTNETPRIRAKRLSDLAGLNPDHREARILFVEQALIAGDARAARAAARALEGEPLTARLAALNARVAFGEGQGDEARMWIGRAAGAPQEPDWSDLDPEGRAFAYAPDDWARLVASFAEAGELIHPRHERRERTLNELPQIPLAYTEAPAFIPAEGLEGLAYEPFDDDPPPVAPSPAPGPAAPRRAAARRRLASAPRAAK